MKILLTHSKSSSKRYYLVSGSMGNAGESVNHVNNHFQIVNGIDRGNGYQGYIAVSYFLTLDYIPQSAKDKVMKIIKDKNLSL